MKTTWLVELFCLLSAVILVLLVPVNAAPIVKDLSSAVTEHFGIKGDIISARLANGTLRFPWRSSDRSVTELDIPLQPFSIRSENFIMITKAEMFETWAGESNLPSSQLYKGAVYVNGANEHVSAIVSVQNDGCFSARIDSNITGVFFIESTRDVTGNALDYVMYNGDDIVGKREGKIIWVRSPLGRSANPIRIHAKSSEATPVAICGGGNSLCQAEIAIEADYEYSLKWQENTVLQIEYSIAIMNVRFERDAGITHKISAIILNTSPVQPYTSHNSFKLLSQFRRYWNSKRSWIKRDIAHLFTGKVLDGDVAGIAWTGVVCNSSLAYGVTQPDVSSSNDAARLALLLKNIASNWNANGFESLRHGPATWFTSHKQLPSDVIADLTVFRDTRTCLAHVSTEGCIGDHQCDDGIFCNGNEVCAGGVCMNGTPSCAYPLLCLELEKSCGTCNFNEVCELGETCQSCPSDCIGGQAPRCGDLICDPNSGENCENCPQDCPGQTQGENGHCCGQDASCDDQVCASACVPKNTFCCGDGMCTAPETTTNCPLDCFS